MTSTTCADRVIGMPRVQPLVPPELEQESKVLYPRCWEMWSYRLGSIVCAALVIQVRMAIDNHPLVKGPPCSCSMVVFAGASLEQSRGPIHSISAMRRLRLGISSFR